MLNLKHKFKIPFIKMHGLGNDFLIIDCRENNYKFSNSQIRLLGNRNLGVGFDQFVLMYNSKKKNIQTFLKFWNSDGSYSSTCGNATRCVADILMNETGLNEVNIATSAEIIKCVKLTNGQISTNMGIPKIKWKDIPLSVKCDTSKLPIKGNPIATSFGNPHCTFFVDNLKKFSISRIGKETEINPLFPQKANVQIAQVIDDSTIEVKVWERGSGITMASGSSACAVAFSAKRLNLVRDEVQIILDGGSVNVKCQEDGVWISGNIKYVFSGKISSLLFDNSE